MDSAQFKNAILSVSDQVVDYNDNIHKRRVMSDVQPGYLKKLIPGSPPEEGEEWECIQKDIEGKIMPGMTHWNSPNFMAYFPAPTSYPSMLGELYSSALAVSAFNWECAPAVTELEIIVMDWLVKMFGLPSCYLSTSNGGGVMQGTTSEAVLSFMVAARERHLAENTAHLSGHEKEEACAQSRLRMVALGSEASHSCTQKAAMILGIRYRSVPVSIEDGFSMTGAALATVLKQCQEEGLEPFYLTATLGTTATCAVDKFGEVAHVLRDHQIWVHVDAAYAGAALVCDEYQHLTQHLECFDSFSMSMSKWLLTNIDAVCCFIKSRHHLVDALSITPAYLRNDASDSGEVVDFRHWGVPLSRRFRALKVWFVIRTYGVRFLKSYIRNHIRLGEVFASLIASRPDLFKIVVKPAYALTVISIVPRIPAVLRKFLAIKAKGSDLSRVTNGCGLQKKETETEKNRAHFRSEHCDSDGLIPIKNEPTSNGKSVTNGISSPKDVGNLTNGQPHRNGLTNGSAKPKLDAKASTLKSCLDETKETKELWLSDGIPKPQSFLNGSDSKAKGVYTNGNAISNGMANDITNGHATIEEVPHLKHDPASNVMPTPSHTEYLHCGSLWKAEDTIGAWLTEYANLATKEVYNLINWRGEIMLTSTFIGGLFVIRINGANPKTEEKYMRRAFDILVSTTEEVLG